MAGMPERDRDGRRIRYRFPRSDRTTATSADWDRDARDAAIAGCTRYRRALDVGAHVGLHAEPLRHRFLHVEAFEPQAEAHACLTGNVGGAGIAIRRIGIGRTNGVGYVPDVSFKNSAVDNVLKEETEKGLVRVGVRSVDSFGWYDVDLIHVSPTANWVNVLLGARATIGRCRPVLWITARNQGALSTEILTMMREFLALGYRCTYAQGNGFVFATADAAVAPPEPPPVSRVRSARLAGERLLVWHSPDLRAGDRRAGSALIGRVLAGARTQAIGSDAGARGVTVLSGPPPLLRSGSKIVRAGRDGMAVDIAAAAEIDLDARPALTLAHGDGGFTVAIDPHAAAVADRLTVVVEDADGAATTILDRATDAIANIDAIVVAVPLRMVSDRTRGIAARLLAAGVEIAGARQDVDPVRDLVRPAAATCYLNRGGGGNPAIAALAGAIGARTAYAEDGYEPGVAIVWGVLRGSKAVIDAARAARGYFYYIDHAYFARGHGGNYRVTRDRFEAGPVRLCPDDRRAALGIETAPWRRDGREILVCPPTEHFKTAHGCAGWLDETLATLRAHTDRPIVIREKPAGGTLSPLPEALATAHALVTHSSNVAIEAAVLGTPVFVAEASAARPVGLTDLTAIERPVYPDRDAWLAHLAYSQFSFEELGNGEAWRLLQRHETMPLLT